MRNNRLFFALDVLSVLVLFAFLTPEVVLAKKNKEEKERGKSHIVKIKEHDDDKDDKRRNDDSVPEKVSLQIEGDGKIMAQKAKVESISGATLNLSIMLGSFTLNMRAETDSGTNFTRRFNGQSSLAEISVGDLVTVHGLIKDGASDMLTVRALRVKDWAIQKRNASFFGHVTGLNGSSTPGFIMETDDHGLQMVTIGSTTIITKNNAIVEFSALMLGDKVHVQGLWNNTQNFIEAEKIKIYVDNSIAQKVFEGFLKTVASTTAPTSFVITSKNGVDYTVQVAVDTAVLNRWWLRAALSQFMVGHKIRVYGALENATINATVVRNENLR